MRPRSRRRPVSSAAGRRGRSRSAIPSSCLRGSPAGRAAREPSWRRKCPKGDVPDGHDASRRPPWETRRRHPRGVRIAPSQRGVEFGFEKLLYEATNARPNPIFQGIEPIIAQKMLTFRGACRRPCAIRCHGVISVGALTPILVCFHKLEITPPSNFNHSRDGTSSLTSPETETVSHETILNSPPTFVTPWHCAQRCRVDAPGTPSVPRARAN